MPTIGAWTVIVAATGLGLAAPAATQPAPAVPPPPASLPILYPPATLPAGRGPAALPGGLLQIKNTTTQTVSCMITVGGTSDGALRLRPRGEHLQQIAGDGDIALSCPDLPGKAFGPLKTGVRYAFMRLNNGRVALVEIGF